MTLAHIHAAAWACFVTAASFMVVSGLDVRRLSPSGVRLSLAGIFLAVLFLNVWRASHRAPRTTLDPGARWNVVASGCVVGFLGFALAIVAVVK
jgi:drug/metabolite transporter (DMT)-like permease